MRIDSEKRKAKIRYVRDRRPLKEVDLEYHRDINGLSTQLFGQGDHYELDYDLDAPTLDDETVQTEEEVLAMKRNRFTDMGVPLVIYLEIILTEITSWVVDPGIISPRMFDMSIRKDGCCYGTE